MTTTPPRATGYEMQQMEAAAEMRRRNMEALRLLVEERDALLTRERALVAALEIAHEFCCDFEEEHPCTPENCQVQRALEGQPVVQDETARLREALESIRDDPSTRDFEAISRYSLGFSDGCRHAAQKARAALSGKALPLSGEEEARRQSRPDDVT